MERSSERLTHITADRARAPGRRPTSTIFSRESVSATGGLGRSVARTRTEVWWCKEHASTARCVTRTRSGTD